MGNEVTSSGRVPLLSHSFCLLSVETSSIPLLQSGYTADSLRSVMAASANKRLLLFTA
jgi:hypothetical protein